MFLPPQHRYRHPDFIGSFRWLTEFFAVSIFVLSLSISADGQGSGRSSVGTGGNHVIQGYVFFPSGRRAEGPIQVRLQSYAAGEISLTVDASGSFLFTNLAPGNYTVVVDAGRDYEIAREAVFIDTDVNLSRSGVPAPTASRRYSVMVHLLLKREDHAKASVIDASLASVPDNALRLYQKAQEQGRSGDSSTAVESLKAALAIYPNFPLAANELGVQYLKLGKAEKAVETLRDAIRLDSNAFSPRLNLGIALLEAKRFSEAQSQLNEAVKRNPNAPIPHMYLGLALAHLGNNDESERELLRAVEMGSGRIPLVHYYLGGLYWKKREYSKAIEQLEKYLQLAPNAGDAARVRATIKDLRSKL